jgi:hypothetical protein
MTKKRRDPDPFSQIREAQDHNLDPGYFTGARFHPMYRSNRPNRVGWVLIAIGGLTVLVLPSMILRSTQPVIGIITVGAMAVLLLAAGVRLVRGPRKRGAA